MQIAKLTEHKIRSQVYLAGWIRPYSTFGNNPLYYTDPMGLDTVPHWSDAKVGDIWGHNNGGSTFYYKWNGKIWENAGIKSNVSVCEVIVRASLKDPAVQKKMFTAAFVSFLANPEISSGLSKLLEGTGVRLADATLSKFRFLGPAVAVGSLVFLKGNNVTQRDFMDWNDNDLNKKLQKGDIEGFNNLVDDWNDKHPRNRIVFRYMSAGEFNNREVLDWGLTVAPAVGPNGAPAIKYITPGFYFNSKSAKSQLALPTAPDVAIWTYETEILMTKIPAGPGNYGKVGGANNELGGGLEATITQPFPIHGFFPLFKPKQ